ncbi:phage major capsid protein [Aerococcus kribbianus]|uniref:Phage major capsid protein n=1 Tax=Aerococcus kribbianus TaxID=2999064 RepID=A0A9X3FNU2_9LACT|nr:MULTISPECIES: phage major capsid protein [unclassified Aerococcus]MCZ0717836.1 phage major capsid protein [Aerococcus sp. YH-aer221]MCZ0726123.1 phage major capsid protein [Aerococcus sp. YH-aer222]
MKLQLSDSFKDARQAFIDAVKANEDVNIQGEAYGEMIDELAETVREQAKSDAEAVVKQGLAVQESSLTPEQYRFFNEIDKEVGYKEEKLLPETTINEIFEDLTTEHPLLNAIGMRSAGPRVKFLCSETSGVAVWGKIFGEIKGQLDAAFSEDTEITNKLTAFVVIPKDLKDLNVNWIEAFVRTQITEAFSVAIELAFVDGDGNDKPIGLNRDIKKGSVSGEVTTYPKKEAEGTLTFATPRATVNELTKVMKYHSTKENGHSLNVSGKVVMVVNPENKWEVEAQHTVLNANGVYVTALPFNIQIVESIAQPINEVTTFIKGRYDAVIGGGVTVRKYDQALPIEDMDLYTAKQFVFGKAKDSKSTAVWTLDIPEDAPGTTIDTPEA